MEDTKLLEELRQNVVEQIEAYNDALADNNAALMSKAEDSLKDAEHDYAEVMAKHVFDKLGKEENPMKAAIEKYDFPILGHKASRDDDGKVKSFELVEDKMRQIDLVKMAKHLKLPHDFQYMIEKFNQLLCLRAAKELKLPAAEIKKISKSFYMSDLARKVELGETPDSNTQICKQLQAIVDKIIFEADSKKKNKYKVNNHDVAYLLMCYTGKGKKTLAVKTQRHAVMHRLVMDVLHRVVTNKKYSLEYKVSKETGEKATSPEVLTSEKQSEVEVPVEEKPAKSDKTA